MRYKSHKGFHRQLVGSLILMLFILFVGCQSQQSDPPTQQADRTKKLVTDEAMVSSAHPLASKAGVKMLKKGGNAVDAAVATAFALNVVEPNMSGIGGGGSMLIWEQDKAEADYVDFYTAKRADSYKNVDYDKFEEDEFNLLSTGIPGTVDGLLQALERHGTLSREEVMEPAISYATEGFPVYMTLAQFIRDNEKKLKRFEGARKTFWPDGSPLDVGEILKQPELAATLENISDNGPSAFYTGENAKEMVKVLNEGDNPVTTKDFAQYEPQWNKSPLCGEYKDYTVLSAPMPQTGFYIIQALNLLEDFKLKQMGLPTVSSEAFDIISSTMRLSIADRREYVTDPNWENIPVNSLISESYADKRRELVGTGKVQQEVMPGMPGKSMSDSKSCFEQSEVTADNNQAASKDPVLSHAGQYSHLANNVKPQRQKNTEGETTHISVVDSDGNAVSLSTTLSYVFGSGAWVNGFMLNNSGFDFSEFDKKEDWKSDHSYRIRASTISPTIILDKDNRARLVIGAPGGGRIPTAILQNILYILEYNLDPLDAVNMPRIFPSNSNSEVQIEKGFDAKVLVKARDMGYDLQALSKGYARMYLVSVEGDKLIGVSDPRHDGEPKGF